MIEDICLFFFFYKQYILCNCTCKFEKISFIVSVYVEFLVLERHKLHRCIVLQLQVKEDCPFKEEITFDARSFKSRIINGFNRCKEYISSKLNEFLHFTKNTFRHTWKSALKLVFAVMAIGITHTGQTSIWHNILRMKYYIIIRAAKKLYNISCYKKFIPAQNNVEKILKKRTLICISVLSILSTALVLYDICKLKESHINQRDFRREITKTVFSNLVGISVGTVELVIRQVAFSTPYLNILGCLVIFVLARFLSVVISGSCFDQYVKNGFLDFVFCLVFLGIILYHAIFFLFRIRLQQL